jgi:hypothetical protein
MQPRYSAETYCTTASGVSDNGRRAEQPSEPHARRGNALDLIDERDHAAR